MNDDKMPQLVITWGSAWRIGCAVWAVPILVGLGILFLSVSGIISLSLR